MAFFPFIKPQKPNILKEMGFVNDQDGIIERYAREKNGWDIHLNHSKQTILNAITIHKPKSIAILGSGWLLDIPIDELSKIGETIYLYDIVHPAQIKHKISKYSNIEIIESDITGGSIQNTWEEIERWKKQGGIINLNSIPGIGFVPQKKTDMIISLNILNQLDILICDYIINKTTIQNEDLVDLRKSIQQKHIESLQKQAFCLISDITEITKNKITNVISERPLAVIDLPKTNYSEQWLWDFDLSGNYYDEQEVTFNVIALY